MQKSIFLFQTEYFILIWKKKGLLAVKKTYFKSLITIQKCDKNVT